MKTQNAHLKEVTKTGALIEHYPIMFLVWISSSVLNSENNGSCDKWG